MRIIGIGDTVYFARIHHETGIYDLCELRVRTVYPDAFVGVDKDSRQAFFLSYEDCDIYIFDDRTTALAVVKEAEKRKKELTKETVGDDDS